MGGGGDTAARCSNPLVSIEMGQCSKEGKYRGAAVGVATPGGGVGLCWFIWSMARKQATSKAEAVDAVDSCEVMTPCLRLIVELTSGHCDDGGFPITDLPSVDHAEMSDS